MSKPILKGIEYHLYVLELPGVGVKVGISGQPAKRLRFHRYHAGNHGADGGRQWVSGPHVEARANERALMALGGKGNRREYIAIDFDTAVAAAKKLRKTRASDEMHAAAAAHAEGVSFFWPAGTTKQDVVRMANEVFG